MLKQAKITYHYNSGFSVSVGSTLLVFDYWEGEGRALSEVGRLNQNILSAYESIYVFVTHGHEDHFDEVIYSWRENLPVQYIVSSDLPIGKRGRRIAPMERIELSRDLTVEAFPSTDLGVSLLVTIYGLRIFHAGDLNMWHWRQESTLREIEAAENAFYAACEPIKKQKIDVCMFPVDPRQGVMYDAGANYFILTMKPRVFIPMHWQDRSEVAIDFARRARNNLTEVVAMTHPGEVVQLKMDETELDIHIIEPPKDLSAMPPRPQRRPDSQRDQEDDPFADTDLPVALDDDEE